MASQTPPVPVAPVAGAETDGYAVTFEWEPVSDARHFRVEWADTETFDGETATAHVQNTHALTLYETLPSDGRAYFWRVQADRAGGWTAWSAPQWFVSGAEEVQAAASPVPGARAAAAAAPEGAIAFMRFIWVWLIASVLLTALLLAVLF